MAVGVHREHDAAVSHHRLDGLRVCSRHRQPTAAGVPQGVEVERVAVVVLRVEEVALLAVGELFGITPSFVEPCRASRFQIAPEHLGHLVILRQSEHRSLGRLRADVNSQTIRQVREDVLPSFLPVLGRAGLAGDVRLLGREIEPATRQAAQFVGSQAGLNRGLVQQHALRAGHPELFIASGGHVTEPLPFLVSQHSTLKPPIGFGVRFLHGHERITRQLSIRRQPAGEPADCREVALDGPRRLSLVLQVRTEPVDAVRRDVGHRRELTFRGNRANHFERAADMTLIGGDLHGMCFLGICLRGFSLASQFRLAEPRPVEVLDVLEVSVDAAMFPEQLLTDSPNLFEDGIGHGYLLRLMDWPKRTCGIDSGETSNGLTSPESILAASATAS